MDKAFSVYILEMNELINYFDMIFIDRVSDKND